MTSTLSVVDEKPRLRVNWVEEPTAVYSQLNAPEKLARGISIGDHDIPWARVFKSTNINRPWAAGEEGFKERGVRIDLENGLLLSVIWGSCTYSDNYDHPVSNERFVEEPELVEVGLGRDEGLLGDPLSWVDVADLPELVQKAGALSSNIEGPPEWWDYWHEAHSDARVRRWPWEYEDEDDDEPFRRA